MKKIKRRRRRLRLSSPIGFSLACILGAALLAGLYVGISWCVQHGPAVVQGIREAILADSTTASPEPDPTLAAALDPNATPGPQNTPLLGTPEPAPSDEPDATPKPRVKDPNAPLGGFTVGLDPERDRNTQYKAEAEYNLLFAQKLAEFLEDKGADVVVTRDSSTEVYSNDARISTIRNANCDIAIRFICNHVQKKTTNGVYVHTATENRGFAQLLIDEYSAATGLAKRKTAGVEIKTGSFYTGTGCPAVQLILGHWTNNAEQKKLYDAEFQDRMIEGIYNALLKQLTG